ncbi:MAG: F0F1 ATP synthase subunit B [Nitrosospira sp.]
MLIDWFTVIAQIVNFLILVWLLKRFLYQPILRALDAREKRIAAELAAADAKKREAENERDEFQQKNDEFEQQRSVLLSRASAEAHAERQRLIAAARTDADELLAQWEEALKREYQDLRAALSQRIGAEVFAIARKVLADLANTTLEAHMTDAFIERLRALSPEEKTSLASITRLPPLQALPATPAAAAAETAGILIRSAFDLPAIQKNAIKAAIKEILDTRIPVRFEARPDLISGIELIANGHKVTWNIAGYLASLEEEIGKLLKSPGEPEPEAGFEAELEPEPELEAESEAEASVKEKNRDKKKLNTPDTPDTPNLKSSEHIR